MSVFFALVRRELGGFFKSLTGYVVIAAVLLLNGFEAINERLQRDGPSCWLQSAARVTQQRLSGSVR